MAGWRDGGMAGWQVWLTRSKAQSPERKSRHQNNRQGEKWILKNRRKHEKSTPKTQDFIQLFPSFAILFPFFVQLFPFFSDFLPPITIQKQTYPHFHYQKPRLFRIFPKFTPIFISGFFLSLYFSLFPHRDKGRQQGRF